jgi:glycosyltransferase involved in cell wall biosynthesis
VCCDDCSKDATYNYVRSMFGCNSKVRVLRHDANKGQTACRKTCFDVASGDWFFTLDHDNVLPPGLCVRLLNHALKHNFEAVSPQELYFFHGALRRLSGWNFNYDVCDFQQMVRSTAVPPSGGQYLFSRHLYESVGGYPELSTDAHGDWMFGYKHTAEGFDIGICPDTFYWHQQVPGSMYFSVNLKEWYEQIRQALVGRISKFDDNSQKLILESKTNGHELINSGKLRLR